MCDTFASEMGQSSGWRGVGGELQPWILAEPGSGCFLSAGSWYAIIQSPHFLLWNYPLI